MKHWMLALLLFFVFILEGTVLKWIIPTVWQGNVAVATHFTLIIVLYIGLFINRHQALAYGLAFGMLQDVVYGPTMIGAFSFAMGVVGYLAGLLSLRARSGMLYSMFIITLGNFMFEAIIYGLYRLFQLTRDPLQWMFFHIMLPSVLINLLFALLVYVPLRKGMEQLASRTVKEA